MGLGNGVMTAGQALRPDLMLAYLVWIGIVGFALNAVLVARAEAACSARPRGWRPSR